MSERRRDVLMAFLFGAVFMFFACNLAVQIVVYIDRFGGKP